MEKKNIVGIIALGLIFLIFIVGGYIFMVYMTDNSREKKPTAPAEVQDLKIDPNQEYIYYENEEELIAELEISREDAIFNLKPLTKLNETLKNEVAELSKNITYMKDASIPNDDDITYEENDEGIYSLKYRSYTNYKYNDYISLIAVDYNYDIINSSVPFALKSYVVDIKSGNILSEEELLKTFNLDESIIKTKIKERLENTQVLGEDNNLIIDVDGTLKDLKYSLYISKNGKLYASFIVKSNEVNYNDNVALN